ncbi:insulin receptor substrate 1 isoform X3 [Drosophila tropicalis]|uniref:insulin receptor substrate 1 isoform X3 n=1 Tax=Drosophila tropicalis TaxID=46794 RepID=UPI0035AB6E25
MDSEMENGVVLKGYHKKLKTMKKKYFVLYNETPHGASRLEYFDSEKKFAQRTEPKRVIHLKNCFNINRRFDTKLKFVVVLSTREGGFGIVFDSENDLRKWLDQLLCLQRDNANITDQVNSSYDHVWQVTIQKKGISEKAGIIGSYHCCLTSKSLTFLCIEPNKPQSGANRTPKVEILLTTIRRCGHASPQCIFYMELGRQSVLGSGELWMETDDASTSRNMHDMILSAMSAKSESNMNVLNVCQGGRSDIVPEPMRKRSSSANEASKPINVLHKRQNALDIRSSISPHHYSYGRERCDSLPTRNITCIDSSNQSFIVSSSGIRSNSISGVRPQPANRYSTSSPLNTPMRCSESEESSISVDETDDTGSFSHYRLNTRASKGIILEENSDDFTIGDLYKINGQNENTGNYIPMTPLKPGEIQNAKKIPKLNCFRSQNMEKSSTQYIFPEHAFEKFGKEFDTDSGNHFVSSLKLYILPAMPVRAIPLKKKKKINFN